MSQVEAIGTEVAEEAAEFLHQELNSRISVETWHRALDWHGLGAVAKNGGFLLRDGGRVVGVYGAVYASRKVNGQKETFCNLHSWCVLDSHRSDSLLLVRALLGQSGLHFYNPTPNPLTVPIFEMLRFRFLDDRVCLLFNVPRPSMAELVTDPRHVELRLDEEHRRWSRDHRAFPWIEQVAVGRSEKWCHIIFRKRRWRGLGCAEVLHVGDPEVFCEYRGRFQRWLLLQRRLPVMQVEARFFSKPPSLMMAIGQPRMVLSKTMEDGDFWNLYTDQVALCEEPDTAGTPGPLLSV